jgi:hypothetical protein
MANVEKKRKCSPPVEREEKEDKVDYSLLLAHNISAELCSDDSGSEYSDSSASMPSPPAAKRRSRYSYCVRYAQEQANEQCYLCRKSIATAQLLISMSNNSIARCYDLFCFISTANCLTLALEELQGLEELAEGDEIIVYNAILNQTTLSDNAVELFT